jgi:hypothetical protein
MVGNAYHVNSGDKIAHFIHADSSIPYGTLRVSVACALRLHQGLNYLDLKLEFN